MNGTSLGASSMAGVGYPCHSLTKYPSTQIAKEVRRSKPEKTGVMHAEPVVRNINKNFHLASWV